MRISPFSSSSLLNRTMLFLLAFLFTLVLQLGIARYQTRYIILPQQSRTEQIRLVSQFLNDVEDSLQTLARFRWDYGDVEELVELVGANQQSSVQLLDRMDMQLGSVSEEQYLLASASSTTFDTFSVLIGQILELLETGRNDEAAALYYDRAEPCGGYLRLYTQQLLECSIRDSQSTYLQLSARSEQLGKIQAVVVGICILSGALMMASLLTLVHSIREMAAASLSISAGNLDIPDVDPSRPDEIGQMARAFNEMKRSMKRQVQTLEEKNEMQRALYKKENEALELQNLMEQEKMQKLRSQINPHFLFNTLNVILYTAQQEGAVRTQSLLTSLSHLFRYALGSNSTLTPLAREVKIVDEFYNLYKVRFGDRVNLRWDLPPEIDLTETLAPSFLIQPLVENAFRHGLAPKEAGGTVWVRLRAEGELLCIDVEDDGAGMSAKALDALQKSLGRAPDTGSHIGLYNVCARVRLLGPEYGASVQSGPGQGTRVSLRLPLLQQQPEEDSDD